MTAPFTPCRRSLADSSLATHIYARMPAEQHTDRRKLPEISYNLIPRDRVEEAEGEQRGRVAGWRTDRTVSIWHTSTGGSQRCAAPRTCCAATRTRQTTSCRRRSPSFSYGGRADTASTTSTHT